MLPLSCFELYSRWVPLIQTPLWRHRRVITPNAMLMPMLILLAILYFFPEKKNYLRTYIPLTCTNYHLYKNLFSLTWKNQGSQLWGFTVFFLCNLSQTSQLQIHNTENKTINLQWDRRANAFDLIDFNRKQTKITHQCVLSKNKLLIWGPRLHE